MMVQRYVCEKCGRTSVYFRGTATSETGICNKPECRALYTKNMVFICYDYDNNINVHYNKDGSIELTMSTVKRLDDATVQVIQKRLFDAEKQYKENEIKTNKSIEADAWWRNLSKEEKISVFESKFDERES